MRGLMWPPRAARAAGGAVQWRAHGLRRVRVEHGQLLAAPGAGSRGPADPPVMLSHQNETGSAFVRTRSRPGGHG